MRAFGFRSAAEHDVVGRVMVRLPRSVFGGLKRNPSLVSSSERSTRSVAASRSTSDNLSACSSPAGYSLTGSVSEHALFFIYGDGGNGKGVFLNALTRIFDDYVTISTMETFASSKLDRHTTDVAMLARRASRHGAGDGRGARLERGPHQGADGR